MIIDIEMKRSDKAPRRTALQRSASVCSQSRVSQRLVDRRRQYMLSRVGAEISGATTITVYDAQCRMAL